MYTYIFTHIYEYTAVMNDTDSNTHVYISSYAHIHIYIYTYVHMYIYTHMHIFIHMFTHAHTHTHIRIHCSTHVRTYIQMTCTTSTQPPTRRHGTGRPRTLRIPVPCSNNPAT